MLQITVGLLGLILYILLDFLLENTKEIFHAQLTENFKKQSPNLKKKIQLWGP